MGFLLFGGACFALGHQWDDRVWPFLKGSLPFLWSGSKGVFSYLWSVTKGVFAKLRGPNA